MISESNNSILELELGFLFLINFFLSFKEL